MDSSTEFRSCASRFYVLYFPFLSFTSTCEVADMAMWWTAAPDFGPAHHASTCSTFLSFRLQALAKWPIWPCGGWQHRISVLHIMLQPALFSFPLRAFAKWPIWPCGGRQHRISVLRIMLQPALFSFPLWMFVKWPIWLCGGRQHRISVPRIMLQHALFSFLFLSFTSVGEVANLAAWWTAAPDFGPTHHAST